MKNFESIYKENYSKMFCVAHKMLVDKDIVSDILQEVFIYYYQKLQNGHQINNTNSWLLRATINKSIDYLKQKKKFIKLDFIDPPIEEDLIERNQDKIIIQKALSELSLNEKTLAILFSEGFSYKEISQITDIKFTSVGKMISRTLTKLNKILKQLNYEMY